MKPGINFLVHSDLEERGNVIKDELEKGKVLPAIVLSCKDGILMVGLSSQPGIIKIRRMGLDRMAFVGIGAISDYQKLYTSASAFASTQAFINLSQGDMRIVTDTVSLISGSIRDRYRNLYGNDYFLGEAMVVKLGLDIEDDDIYRIDFTGRYDLSKSISIIPSFTKGLDLSLPWVELTCKIAFKTLLERVSQQYNQDLFYEIAVLSREEARNKRFSRVYSKLSPDMVQQYLNQ